MKKHFLLLVVSLFAVQGMAQQISETQAQQIASKFFGINPDNNVKAQKNVPATLSSNPFGNDSQPKLEYVVQSNGNNNVYIYNITNGGFIIIAGDERAPKKVLGYSTSGHIDVQNMSPVFKNLMDGYSKEIDNIRDADTAQTDTSGNEFIGNVIVEPLIKTKWYQKEPYNRLCPNNSITGCVATAMAQIMNYYQWPKHGYGKHTNIIDTTLTVDFSESVYDWDNMLDSYKGEYTEEQANAVAKLMYDCGVAVDMYYGLFSSGAYSDHIESAMSVYFNYKSTINIKSDKQTEYDIFSSIKKECDAKHPLLISGNTILEGEGRHEFICDGYAENDYFHFNLGWAGNSDGYYVISSILKQEYKILGVIPDTDHEPVYITIDNNNYFIKNDSVAILCLNKHVGNKLIVPDFISDGSKKWPVVDMIGRVIDILSLESITIGNNVNRINTYAFGECKNLNSVTIGNSVSSIEDNAFVLCYGLTSIVIPNSVTYIGDNAFGVCNGLTSIVIPNSVTYIGDNAFRECNGLTSIVISNSATCIGNNAFRDCCNLTKIEIPNSVTTIGEGAFQNCPIESLSLGSNVESIGNEAFSNCSHLTAIEIPNSATYIGDMAFENCYEVESITIGNGVSHIGIDAFKNCKLNKADFVNNSTLDGFRNNYWGAIILDYVVDGMYIVDSVLVKYLGDADTVVIPDNVTAIGEKAFANNINLSSIDIPNSVTSIGDSAFYNCRALTSVTLGSGVKTIGD